MTHKTGCSSVEYIFTIKQSENTFNSIEKEKKKQYEKKYQVSQMIALNIFNALN